MLGFRRQRFERQPAKLTTGALGGLGGAKLNLALVRNVRTWPAMPREKMLWGGGGEIVSIVADVNRWSPPNANAE